MGRQLARSCHRFWTRIYPLHAHAVLTAPCNPPRPQVTAAKLAAGAVTASSMAAGAVTASSIAAGAVTASSMAAGAVSYSSLADGTVALIANEVTDTRTIVGAVTLSGLTPIARGSGFSARRQC